MSVETIMGMMEIIPVEFKEMSIITLLLLIFITYIFYLIFNQIRNDLNTNEEEGKKRVSIIKEEHKILKKDFEGTRKELYDKINEIKENFSDIKVTIGRTQEMVKGNVDIQRIIQKDISEIRERLNRK